MTDDTFAKRRPGPLALEIIDCENGYIVLEGNSLGYGRASYVQSRRKWVVHSAEALANLIGYLASADACGKENT